ncbi:MAG: CoB--CoM heterodisulfide reductase iron-sulfur subunit A family protein [Nitrososphaerota archaeon]|jgi:heterodisulfide reductase subunit A|nr:CoB--CoM heterodisulfide reductase iron-sulfur subunit A family protein [Nitrososphaerota archaeon]MDG6948146.1 CoB--CoM heterodisulfide reductase iron-sulfur subunit A family protein [Nitrososphaerota archaeon]
MAEALPVLIIGAGPAGLRAALDLAEMDTKVILVEKRGELGGAPIRWKYKLLAPELRPSEEVMGPLLSSAESNPLITLHKDSYVDACDGPAGNFRVVIGRNEGGGFVEKRVSSIVVATGFEHFDARVDPRYSYGRAPNVIGINELEGMLKEGRVAGHDGNVPKRVAFIFCVGSRDRATNPWCCTVCCGVSIKQAIEMKELIKDVQLYMIYMDIRTMGQWEKLYWDSMEKYGINYIRGRVAEVYWTGKKLLVKGEDTLVRGPFEVLFDMVVLAVGIEPGPGTKKIAATLGLQLNENGFLAPRHPNVHTESTREGVFLAGCCVTPMSIEEALAEGSAAAMAATKFAKKVALKVKV